MTNCIRMGVLYIRSSAADAATFASNKIKMNTQITTLSLNLIISERFSQRLDFANEMKNIIGREFDLSPVAEVFKKHFFSHINRCVENPNCSSRPILFALADFWMEHFMTKRENAFFAA